MSPIRAKPGFVSRDASEHDRKEIRDGTFARRISRQPGDRGKSTASPRGEATNSPRPAEPLLQSSIVHCNSARTPVGRRKRRMRQLPEFPGKAPDSMILVLEPNTELQSTEYKILVGQLERLPGIQYLSTGRSVPRLR